MAKPTNPDPYAGNILVQPLGQILSREQALVRLTSLPPLPCDDMSSVPRHVRLHMLMAVRDFHLPSLEGARILQTTDLVIRQGYRYRDPMAAEIWGAISDDPLAALRPRVPAMAAVCVGHSGCGKTVAIQKSFDCYPRQIIMHDSFPRLRGPHYQMVYLSADVPPSGRTVDLAANLMIGWDDAVSRVLPDAPRRFEQTLSRERRDGTKMMDEWRQVAVSHFLGCLHLDEVGNFFKIPSLERRRGAKAGKHERADFPPELRIIDDQALKMVLTMFNTWQIPGWLSGTADGVGALTKRLSNVQRFVTSGYHKMSEFSSAADPAYVTFIENLGRYQYVAKRLHIDDALRALIFKLTAGIPRIIVALWIAAHRVAFERKDDDLRLEDFTKAAATYLAPVAPAVAAVLSKDPIRMRLYEDLMPRDDSFWGVFWGGVASL